jgi:hypothetical protein
MREVYGKGVLHLQGNRGLILVLGNFIGQLNRRWVVDKSQSRFDS